MTAFSLRQTRGANAVSQLHATTANGTWQGTPALGHPRHHQRHPPSDLAGRADGASCSPTRAPELDALTDETAASRFWERLDAIPDEQLWKAHTRQKRELAIFARGRLLSQFARHGASPAALESVERVLDPERPDASASRGASRPTSARGAAVQRLRAAGAAAVRSRSGRCRSSSPARPTPPTGPGSASSSDIFERTSAPRLAGRVFILEDYDMRIARYLVQGVDVWLNNPRRPLEARARAA